MTDVTADKPRCWVCAGTGQITTGETERVVVCGNCNGSGISDTVPTNTNEMVAALANMPGVERRTLSAEYIDAAWAKWGPIIEEAMREIEEEERGSADQKQ